jgi:SNF2 family DNA or RNA helicase
MGRIKEKKGSSHRRIIESDSESEVDVAELSMSMNHAPLIDGPPPEADRNFGVQRKPPRGRNIQRLEDFSWSSSDEESEGSYTTSCSSNRNKPKKKIEEKSIMSRNKGYASTISSSSANHPTILSSDRKTSDTNASFTSTRKKPVRSKLESSHVKRAFSSDISFSDSSSSSLSILLRSDDECSLISTESNQKSLKKKKKKHFSWSFNKNRQEYTIGGSGKLPAFSIPSNLYDQLYDFQKEGVTWMASLHLPKIGGILGDDMGMVNSTQRWGKPHSSF